MTNEAARRADGRLYFERDSAVRWNKHWSAVDREHAERFLDWLDSRYGPLRYYDTPSATSVSIQAAAEHGPTIVAELTAGYLQAHREAPGWFASTPTNTRVFQFFELSNSQVGRPGGQRNSTPRENPVCPKCFLAHAGKDCE